MIATIKKMLFTAAVLVSAAFNSHAAHAQRQELNITNDSSFRLDHIYISPHSSGTWGRDLLGDGYLHPDYQISFYVQPNRYDVMLIDKDGDKCVIPNVGFYRGTNWTVTNAILLTCEVFS